MVAPWNKFSVRAALWYQGEANADQKIKGNDQAQYYAAMYQGMIADWRKHATCNRKSSFFRGNSPLFLQFQDFSPGARWWPAPRSATRCKALYRIVPLRSRSHILIDQGAFFRAVFRFHFSGLGLRAGERKAMGDFAFMTVQLPPSVAGAAEKAQQTVRVDGVCFVYTCRRLINLSLIAGAHGDPARRG